jgi:hypothetical protein
MRALRRTLTTVALVGAASVTVLGAAVLLALSSTGVLNTAGNAWTVPLRVAGVSVALNVAGLVRLATLPGLARLADGKTLQTEAGTLTFARNGARLIARCAPCRIAHPDLATRPVTVRALELTVARSGDTIAGELAIDRVVLSFDTALHPDRIDLRWRLDATPIAAVYEALGAAIPETYLARIDGMMRAQGRLALPSRKGSIGFEVADFSVAGLGTESLQHGAFSVHCTDADGNSRPMRSGEGAPNWLPADRMGPYVAAAVIAAEDQRFATHDGFDQAEVARLLDALGERPARGASTITQQLARTLYTGGERTAARKLRELLYAVEMERTLGKGRLIELYLNTVDWGPGICGVKVAARTYFNRSPRTLTPLQAAWLAAILRNPGAAHASQFAARKPDDERARAVLMQMRSLPRTERLRWARSELSLSEPKESRPRSTTLATRAKEAGS